VPSAPKSDRLALALGHHRAGRSGAAAALYRSLLALDPADPEALHGLGALALQAGRPGDALCLLNRTLICRPDHPRAWANLGAAWRAQGRDRQALRALGRALALMPGSAQPQANLANLLKTLNRSEAAGTAYRRALHLEPALAEIHNNLGNALAEACRLNAAAARYRAALALRPGDARTLGNLAAVLKDGAGVGAALAACRRALRVQPELAEAHNTLGLALQSGQGGAAPERFRAALALAPGYGEAWFNLGAARRSQGDPEAAETALRRAHACAPERPAAALALADLRLELCDFSAEDLGRELAARAPDWLERLTSWHAAGQMAYLWPYFGLPAPARRPVTERINRLLCAQAAARPRPAVTGTAAAGRGRLRVGYVSPDFGNRPMGQVTRALFAAHDRRRLEVFGYASRDRSADPGPYWADIGQGCDRFTMIAGLEDGAAAERIAADGIDVLVDLNGYMTDARPGLFALRPAPLQVYWLGHHGGSLGLECIDYILADPVVLPPGAGSGGPERVVRLPEVFHPADTPPIAELALSRAEAGLGEDGVVFCAFNNPQKLDRESFAAWMRILARVPGSRLWLASPDRQPGREANLRRAASALGVDPGRLVFAGRRPDKAEHFARHRLADLFLDCFRVTASTTAIDALWAGLPVLTVAGTGFPQRIAASLVSAAGLGELVCPDRAAFEERAVALAREPAALAGLKARLAAARSRAPLFDISRLARALEAAFAAMLERHRAGLPPADFDLAPLAPAPPVAPGPGSR
jgi:predicted O-linked N-acetylglucosamine transferase (SPINDLY family)